MKIRLLFASSALLMGLATSGFAASIVWVSEMMPIGSGTSDRTGGTDGIFGSGAGPYADQGVVDLLTSAGHTVTRFNPSDGTDLSADHINQLNSHDLIIVGRSIPSGNFGATRANAWNTQITKPLISTNSYLSRSGQLGWFTGGNLPDQISNPLTFDLSNPAAVFLAGDVALSGSTTVDSYTLDVGSGSRGTSVLTDAPVAGSTLIATGPVGAATGHYIVGLEAGTTLTGNAAGQVLAGYRLHFLLGDREPESAAVVGNAGYNNLTPDGEAIFLRAVELALNNGVVVPEPAMASLLLVAGSALLRRRRAA